MKKCLIYARFSTAEQSKGFSLDRQTTRASMYAESQGWTVERVITDEGRSAYHGANRNEGSALHAFEDECRRGLHQGKVLLCENVDRLTRQGARAAARLIWGLNECAVAVATYHDGRVYAEDGGDDLLDILNLVLRGHRGHGESDTKSKRTTDSWGERNRRIEAGEFVPLPHVPPWLRVTRQAWKLHTRRVEVLNEIFDLYIDGLGIHRIVTQLNDRREPSWLPEDQERQSNGWFYSYVYRLLTKRSVLGEYATGAGRTINAHYFPQAITAEKWNRAQAALAMRKGNQRTTKTQGNRNLLSQLVFCDQCGGGAHFRHQIDKGQTYTRKSGEVVTYRRNDHRRLRCDRARRRHDCDNATILNYDVVETTILNELLPRLTDRRAEDRALVELRERIAELSRDRDADQVRLDNLVDALAEGGSRTIVQRISALEAQVERKGQEIEAAENTLVVATAKPSGEDDVALVHALRAELNSLDNEVRIFARGRANMGLRRLIKRIVITSTGGFRVEPDDQSWWLFGEDGKLLEGAHVPG